MESAKAAKVEDEKTSTEKTKRYRRTLRAAIVVTGGVLILFLATFFPGLFGGWRSKPSQAKSATTTTPAVSICPDVSSKETRGCLVGETWPNWIRPAEGPAVDGMEMCSSPITEQEKKEENGTTFWRWKVASGGGTVYKIYRLFPGGCPSVIPPH